MNGFALGLIVGIFLGALIGIVIAAILTTAGRYDRIEETRDIEKEWRKISADKDR